jgi:hypothetical protein
MADRPRAAWELELEARAREKRNLEMLARLSTGASFAAVGAAYGISGERVRQIARQLGYAGRRNPHWPPEADARLRDLAADGLSASLIAQQVGTTKDAVTSRARRLGLLLSGTKTARGSWLPSDG